MNEHQKFSGSNEQSPLVAALRRASGAETRKHQHAEAFCLLHYECRTCRHHEIIWNSRDGVTPFCTRCPSCGEATLQHAYFGSDRYAPEHKPHHGQRIWVSMTKERAYQLALVRVLATRKESEETDAIVESVASSFYREGHAPALEIHGYRSIA